ncbi:ribosome recycling factor [Leyella stercorea]|uniref:ribosome recycling factor n=1 Tax=Leyella stercorea TaxID=363265 RepID=UPI00242DB09F|nr:ribosome recycling factor [Leyella stercorea]
MSEAYIEDFLQKVESGLMEAQKHMLEEKALHNSSVVVSDGNGCVLEIPARKILAEDSKS